MEGEKGGGVEGEEVGWAQRRVSAALAVVAAGGTEGGSGAQEEGEGQ